MFWSFLLVTLMLCSCLEANSVGISIKKDTALPKLKLMLENRCLKNANANAYNELKASVDNFVFCIAHNTRPPNSQADALNMVCHEYRQASYRCAAEVLKKVEPCLDPQEKYLPKFILGGHNRTLDQYCKDGASRMQNLMPSLMPLQCNPPNQAMAKIVILRCFPKLRSLKILSNPDYLFTQPSVCGDLKTTKECFTEVLKSHCTNEGSGLELLHSYFNILLAPCGPPSGK